jgi:predicted dehydrogenase
MNIVQVGLGSFGKQWMNVVHKDDRWSHSGIATRNQDTLRRCGTDLGVPEEAQFSSLESMLLGTQDADAVLITTPYFLHTEQILLALEHGKHVLVEKPLCGSIEDAYRIRDAVKESGKTLMVAENYRFSPGSIHMHDLVSSGVIGNPELVFIQYFVKHRFPDNDWRNKYTYPVLIENATHHFDLLRYITGSEPESALGSAFGSNLTKNWAYPSVSIQYEMSGGVNFHFAASWAYDGFKTPWEGVWRVHGTEGSIVWDGEAVKVFKDTEAAYKVEKITPKDSLKMVLREFTAALTEGRRPSVDIDDNIKTLQMVFSAIESIEKSKKIHIS